MTGTNQGELRDLKNQILSVREKLNHLGDNNTCNLSDPSILQVSRELDNLLNIYESKRKEKNMSRLHFSNRPEA